MNILFLSTWFPYPPDNGSKLRAYHLVRSLACDHHVTVIAFRPQDHGRRAIADTVLFDQVRVWAVPEDPFRHVGLPQMAKYLSPIPLAAWPSRAMRRAVSEVARNARWDAVVAFQTPVAQYALMLSGAARVFDIDNSLSFIGSERLAAQKGTLARLKARISLFKSVRYEARLARRFQACTVVSPLERDFVLGMVRGAPCRVEVHGNGVDCAHNRQGLAQTQPNTLVYNGALTYSANYDAMR